MRRYVEGLYRVAHDNRRLLRALMAASEDSDPALAEVAAQTSRRFANALGRIYRVLVVSGPAHGFTLDPPVHRDWLLPESDQDIGTGRLIDEMTTMLLHGISHRRAEHWLARP